MPSVERLQRREQMADVQTLAPDTPGRGVAYRHRALNARDVRTQTGGSLRRGVDRTLRRHRRRHGDLPGMSAVDPSGSAGGPAIHSIRPALHRIRRRPRQRDHRGFSALPNRSAEKACGAVRLRDATLTPTPDAGKASIAMVAGVSVRSLSGSTSMREPTGRRIAVAATRFRADGHEPVSGRRRRPEGTGGEVQRGCGATVGAVRTGSEMGRPGVG